MIADRIGRFTMGDLPDNIAAIQINSGDGGVGWLDQGEPLNGKSATATCRATSTCRPASAGFTRARTGEDCVSPRVFPRAGPHAQFLYRSSGDEVHVGELLCRTHQADRCDTSGAGVSINRVCLG